MVTHASEVHSLLLPVTQYVVVSLGEAIGEAQSEQLRLSAGLQTNLSAPEMLSVRLSPF